MDSKGSFTDNSYKEKMQNVAPNPNRRARNERNQIDEILKKCQKKEVYKEKSKFIVTTDHVNSHVSKDNSRRSWTPLKSQRSAINDLVKPLRQHRRNKVESYAMQKTRVAMKSTE
jgi:hypothetical protein